MNQVQESQKDRVLKTLAVFGFLAIIIFGVWLAVRIVTLMPQAFSSLASIADGVYNTEVPELTVSTPNSAVASGKPFTISWNTVGTAGQYSLNYQCTDGVSMLIAVDGASPSLVACGETTQINSETGEAELIITSEREREADVTYTLAYARAGENEALVSTENTIMVVNDSIPVAGEVAGETTTEEQAEEAVEEETIEPAEESTEVVTETPEPVVSTPLPTVVETIVLETPTSDPNGTTDLAVQLLAVGQLTDAGDFVAGSRVDNDTRGAFQFEVRNIGSKASTDWDFVATLTSGSEFDAPLQDPLQPQERVVFTLGYDNVGEDGINLIGVTVRDGDDVNGSNNSFTWAVSVVE